MQPELDAVIQQKVRALPLSMQEDVLEYVERISSVHQSGSTDTIERLVAQNLIANGLVDEIPSALTDEEDAVFELVEVQGEALSDAIIRERR